MTEADIDTLKAIDEKVNRRYEARKKRMRKRYRYARDKGFSSTQAQILCAFGEERIDRLAAARDANK